MDCDQKGILFINNMKYAASLHFLLHCKGTSVKEKFLKNLRIRTCNENFKKTTILIDEKKEKLSKNSLTMMYPDWKCNEDDQESDYNESDEVQDLPYTSSDDKIYEENYLNTNMDGESLQKERFQICTSIHNFSGNTEKNMPRRRLYR